MSNMFEILPYDSLYFNFHMTRKKEGNVLFNDALNFD